MKRIKLKPISSNDAWKGRRFSTPQKKNFETLFLYHLRGTFLDIPPPYHIQFQFHISKMQDLDNCLKTTQDCLAKFYGFNDRDIYKITAEKVAVSKGEEAIEFDIIRYI